MLNLTIAPNPFTQDRHLLTRPAGGSLRQVLDSTGWPAEYMAVSIDGVPVPPDRWEWLMPREGQLITARVYPKYGGNSRNKNIGRIVAGVVLIVAAVATANAGLGLTAAQVSGGGILGISSGSLALAGTALVAAGLLGLVTPVPKPLNSGVQDNAFSIAGTRNVFEPYGVVPKVYGLVRTYPKVAAVPFTEISGADQYLRMVFEVGYLPMTISDIRIGETAIADFGEVQYEIRDSVTGESPLTLYTRDVVEEALSILLTNAGGWFTQTTALETDEISIDVSALSGFGRYDSTSVLRVEIVYLRVQYAPTGTTDWVNIPNGDTETGAVIDVGLTNPVRVYSPGTAGRVFAGDVLTFAGILGTTELNGNTYEVAAVGSNYVDLLGVDGTAFTPYVGGGGWTRQSGIFVQTRSSSIVRRNKTWSVPRGQYDVRIMRMDNDETATNIADKLTWTALRSFKNVPPITATGRALIAIRIKASEKLNGVVDELNCLAQNHAPVYDGAAWSVQPTTNPAWAYADTLAGTWQDMPLALSRLDAEGLKAWADRCDAAGREFNFVLNDDRTIFEMLQVITQTGRAAFGMKNDLYSVVEDRPQSTVVQHFTPRNTWDFEGERAFYTIPHALKIDFLNEEKNFLPDTRIVYDDGYHEGNATEFEGLQWEGITDPQQVWKEGRFHLAQMRLRAELYRFNTDMEHLVCTRGDLVRLSNQAALLGLGTGRITRLLANTAGDCTGIQVDTEWTQEAETAYGVRMRLGADNSSLVKELTTVPGTAHQVTFAEPIAAGGTFPAVGDLVMFGESGLETIEGIVKAIEPFDGIHARLTLIDAAPGVHLADQGDIPPYQSHITLPANVVGVTLAKPILLSIDSDEFTLLRGPDGSLQSRIVVRLGLASSPSGQTRFFEGQFRLLGETAWAGLPLVTVDPGELIVMPVQDGETYELRLRALSGIGAASDWTTPVAHTVIGKNSPPPDVERFTTSVDADGTRRFEWSLTEPPDFAGVQIKYKAGTGHAWEDLDQALHTGYLLNSPFETNLIAAGTYTIGIKAVDTSTNFSTNAKLIEGTFPNPRLAGALVQESARAQGWPGTKTGCAVEGTALVAQSSKSWQDLIDEEISWEEWLAWNFEPVDPIVYEHPPIDVGAVLPFTPLVTVTGQGTPTITEAHSDDDVTYTSFAALGPQVTARYIKFKVSQAHADARLDDVFIILDAKAETDTNNDLDTSTISSPAGTFRIPLNKNFSLIRFVNVILQNVGPGWTWELIDRNAALGPLIKIYDNTGTLADAVVDTDVKGVV
ncbi:MAG: host specificity factor TipJ family phage tail protein [Nitrospirales bacterium]